MLSFYDRSLWELDQEFEHEGAVVVDVSSLMGWVENYWTPDIAYSKDNNAFSYWSLKQVGKSHGSRFFSIPMLSVCGGYQTCGFVERQCSTVVKLPRKRIF